MIPRSLVLAIVLTAAAPALALAQGNPSFNVINKSGMAIRELFATPAGDANFGRSRLNGRAIPAGGAQVIRLPAGTNCIYDIRIAYADGRNEDRRAVNTCRGSDLIAGGDAAVGVPAGSPGGVPAGARQDPSFRLFNGGSTAVVELYATPAGNPKRGENRLASSGVIAPGAAEIIRIQGGTGCLYDLHVVFADRASRDKKSADLCKITDLPVK